MNDRVAFALLLLACACSAASSCSVVTQNGHTLDFSPLAGVKLSLNDSQDDQYIFTMCEDLPSTPYPTCSKNAQSVQILANSYCVVTGTAAQASWNSTGDYASVTYGGGQRCGDGTMRNFQINFVCDPDHEVQAVGQVQEEPLGSCHYSATVNTRYACVNTPPAPKACSVRTANGNTLDFSPLAGTKLSLEDADENTYYFTLCENFASGTFATCTGVGESFQVAPPSEFCTMTGVADQQSWKSSGDDVAVTYGGGKKCGNTPRQFSINLKCDPNHEAQPMGQVQEVPAGSCHYVATVNTRHACVNSPPHADCNVKTQSGFVLDFEAIADMTLASSDANGNKYTFGVCSNAQAPSTCSQQESEGYMVASNGYCTTVGSLDKQTWNSTGDYVSVTYGGGQACGNVNRSFMIDFLCDKSTEAQVVGQTIEAPAGSCQYVQRVKSKYACTD